MKVKTNAKLGKIQGDKMKHEVSGQKADVGAREEECEPMVNLTREWPEYDRCYFFKLLGFKVII